MKTFRPILQIAGALALATLVPFTSTTSAAPKPPPQHVELKVTGPIFSLPDHTAGVDSDQCRGTGLDTTTLVQRKTTLDLSALGLGALRKALVLDFGADAEAEDPVTISFWPTKNCQLLVVGEILSGQWPLTGGAPGPDLVVIIPAGTPWTFNRVGGGSAACSGNPALNQDVFVTIRRNDARTGDVCDCPSDYTDADGNRVADECE